MAAAVLCGRARPASNNLLAQKNLTVAEMVKKNWRHFRSCRYTIRLNGPSKILFFQHTILDNGNWNVVIFFVCSFVSVFFLNLLQLSYVLYILFSFSFCPRNCFVMITPEVNYILQSDSHRSKVCNNSHPQLVQTMSDITTRSIGQCLCL